MTREEAIAILQEEIDGNLELTLSEWRERDEQKLFPAIRMAITALQAEYEDYEHATLVDIKEPLKVEVVRCKDCLNYNGNGNKCNWGMKAYDDAYCSHGHYDDGSTPILNCADGELADKTKYPATYNTNTKCGGCVHLDELGRCLNFMLAKDDKSCWRGSWENNNGELAEQTDKPNTALDEVFKESHDAFRKWEEDMYKGRPHGEWHSCSEEMPEENEVVLVAVKEKNRLPKWVEEQTYHIRFDVDAYDSELGWTHNNKKVWAWHKIPKIDFELKYCGADMRGGDADE